MRIDTECCILIVEVVHRENSEIRFEEFLSRRQDKVLHTLLIHSNMGQGKKIKASHQSKTALTVSRRYTRISGIVKQNICVKTA